MSFLDNLESSLKSLESRDEAAQQGKEDRRYREAEEAKAIAAAPYAEALREGPFAAGLLNEAAVLGHGLRTKVRITWIGTTLRLEARERRLELRPSSDGVVAVFLENGSETATRTVDLTSNPAALA